MDKKCCPRADVQATHWEGCHTSHPECAAWRAGREHGMREAAGIADPDKVPRGIFAPMETYRAAFIRDAILAAIGEGE